MIHSSQILSNPIDTLRMKTKSMFNPIATTLMLVMSKVDE
jgi:hypothetical protein